MTEPYTDATVLRIADGLTEYPAGACDCGECRQRIVRAVLDALTAAGLLIPEGSETREQYGVRLTWDDGRQEDGWLEDRALAERRAASHRRRRREQAEIGRVWLVTPTLIRRGLITTPPEPVTEEAPDAV